MPTVSTQGTEQLKLYKNSKLYNGSRYQFYLTNREQAFQTFLGTPAFTKTVGYKSISEPILLNEFIKDCDELTYGSITNEDKIYYFFVDSITTDAYKQTTINYTIDWWTTNWSKIQCTVGHITRKKTSPDYMSQPYTPLYTQYVSSAFGGSYSNHGSIMFTYIPSIDGVQSYISLGMLELNESNLALVQNGYWKQKFNIAGSDIKDCFIVPLISPTDIATQSNTVEEYYVDTSTHSGTLGNKLHDAFEDSFPDLNPEDIFPENPGSGFDPQTLEPKVFDTNTGKFYVMWYMVDIIQGILWYASEVTVDESDYSYRKVLITEHLVGVNTIEYEAYWMSLNDDKIDSYTFNITGLNIKSTDQYKQGIQDWNSDLIWECPYGINVTSFKVRMLVGLSHIMLEFIPNGSNKNGTKLTGAGFNYDCRHPGLFLDSYQEYVLKNREYDIEMRRIQSEKQEIQAWANVAENVGFGMAFGQMKGAQAAGIGGIIEASTTTLLNSLYDPQIQQQYDARYQRMTDQVSLVGDALTDVYNERDNGLLQLYTLSMDTPTQTRMSQDIINNGFYCDETTDNVQSYFWIDDGSNVKHVIQADNVVVEGACNVIGKQQIVRRLQNGVEFITDDTPVPPTPTPGTQYYTVSNVTQDHTIHAEFEVDE